MNAVTFDAADVQEGSFDGSPSSEDYGVATVEEGLLDNSANVENYSEASVSNGLDETYTVALDGIVEALSETDVQEGLFDGPITCHYSCEEYGGAGVEENPFDNILFNADGIALDGGAALEDADVVYSSSRAEGDVGCDNKIEDCSEVGVNKCLGEINTVTFDGMGETLSETDVRDNLFDSSPISCGDYGGAAVEGGLRDESAATGLFNEEAEDCSDATVRFHEEAEDYSDACVKNGFEKMNAVTFDAADVQEGSFDGSPSSEDCGAATVDEGLLDNSATSMFRKNVENYSEASVNNVLDNILFDGPITCHYSCEEYGGAGVEEDPFDNILFDADGIAIDDGASLEDYSVWMVSRLVVELPWRKSTSVPMVLCLMVKLPWTRFALMRKVSRLMVELSWRMRIS
jgi:hypothetical protein